MQILDEKILLFIQEHLRFDPITVVMDGFTQMGDAGIMWIALGLVLLYFSATRKHAIVYLLALGGTAAVNNLMIKPLVMRPRPYDAIEGLIVLTEKLSSYSFPSGHASSSFAAAAALTVLFGKKGAWSFVPAAIIALSRPYLGMHYLSDVICGAALGAVCGLLITKLLKPIILKEKTHGESRN